MVGIKVRCLSPGDVFCFPGSSSLFTLVTCSKSIAVCCILDVVTRIPVVGVSVLFDLNFIVELAEI